MKKILFTLSILLVFTTLVSCTVPKKQTEKQPTPEVEKQVDFLDVTKEHPYYEAINYIREKQIDTWYSDWTFKPE